MRRQGRDLPIEKMKIGAQRMRQQDRRGVWLAFDNNIEGFAIDDGLGHCRALPKVAPYQARMIDGAHP